MTIFRISSIFLLLVLVIGCSSSPPSKPKPINLKPEFRQTCQIFEPAETKYSFSAFVLDIKRVYKYNNSQLRNFPVTRLVANTIKIRTGQGLLDNQAIFIDLAPQVHGCRVHTVCDFVAPRRNNASEALVVMDAIVVKRQ